MSDAGSSKSVTVYSAADVPADALVGEAVAVLGYGHLGRTAALNLRDSGVKILVGNREDEYAVRARAEGFEVVPLAEAAGADVVFVLLPDEVIPQVFPADVAPALRPGGAVAFASGYSVAFGLVHPPDTVDVLLVAPRMGGAAARARYLGGEGFWACVGVEADRSGRARRRMLGLADALGALRAGAIEMRAADEAALDLFVEQAVGPLLGAAIMAAFEIGRDAGLPPEALVMEMYMSGEMEAVFRAFREIGFLRASEEHGPTAVFGGLLRTLELDREAMAARFRAVLEDIRSGAFARRFQDEARNGYPVLDMARAMIHGPSQITDAEDRLRRLGPTSGWRGPFRRGRGHLTGRHAVTRRGLVLALPVFWLLPVLLGGCFLASWSPKRPAADAVSGPAVYAEGCEACHATDAVKAYAESLHAALGIRCGQCHAAGSHPDFTQPVRDAKCGGCHLPQFQQTVASRHFATRVQSSLDGDRAARAALRRGEFTVADAGGRRFAGDRGSGELGGRLCAACHFDEHRLGLGAVRRADFCIGCHAGREEHFPAAAAPSTNRCVSCHVRLGETVTGQVVDTHRFALPGAEETKR